MPADRELIAEIQAGLRSDADGERAPGMQAYMKSSMPYLGVRVPRVRALTRAAAHRRPAPDVDTLLATVRELWAGATHREERSAATALLDTRAARSARTPGFLDTYAELIVNGAWWDHVDELSHRVGELVVAFPDDVVPTVRGWACGDDLWLRRSSIICQVGLKDRTDVALLTAVVEPNARDREFFIRKAIGWALRDYARTDPAWVRRFVDTHDLQPLSVREALKHL